MRALQSLLGLAYLRADRKSWYKLCGPLMLFAVFLKTLPFFALIGLGFGAARFRFFPPEATAWLTKFVFYFALSAMLFRLSATLPLSQIWDLNLALAYLSATLLLYGALFSWSLLRGSSASVATIEAQAGSIGNVGFLGLPMLSILMGASSAGPILIILTIDMIVFSSLVTLLITALRGAKPGLAMIADLGLGLIKNPMVASMIAGFVWSAGGLAMPAPLDETLLLLGSAATPCALFAIGASLARKSDERPALPAALSFAKLILHPALAALMGFAVFPLAPEAASVIVATTALPVAGNIYILAQHYGVIPQRVSAAILISTACSIVTIPLVIAWVTSA